MAYQLPDIIVEKGDPKYSNPQGVRHHRFGHYPLPAPDLPFIARRETLRAGSNFGLHQLDDSYSLWVIRRGRGIHLINGHPYGIRRGDVYIMPPGGVHGYRDYKNIESDAFYFQAHLFSSDELKALQEVTGFWDLFVPVPRRKNSPAPARFHDRRLHLLPEQYRTVEATVAAIRNEICSSLAVGPMMARYRFYCLLGTLALWHCDGKTGERAAVARTRRARSRTEEDAEVFHIAELAEVVAYCDEHFEQNLKVEQLAARMYLSPNHFSRIFAAQVGMPPARYLRSLRLERAQTLLRDTKFSVTQIANQTGFADVEHLIHAFRATFNCTPLQYRQSFHRL